MNEFGRLRDVDN